MFSYFVSAYTPIELDALVASNSCMSDDVGMLYVLLSFDSMPESVQTYPHSSVAHCLDTSVAIWQLYPCACASYYLPQQIDLFLCIHTEGHFGIPWVHRLGCHFGLRYGQLTLSGYLHALPSIQKYSS